MNCRLATRRELESHGTRQRGTNHGATSQAEADRETAFDETPSESEKHAPMHLFTGTPERENSGRREDPGRRSDLTKSHAGNKEEPSGVGESTTRRRETANDQARESLERIFFIFLLLCFVAEP